MHAIGSCLVDAELAPIVAQHVGRDAFYAPVHESISDAIVASDDNQQPVNLFTVVEELWRRNLLERVGGVPYLRSLLDAVDTASSAEYHAKIVREKAQLRR